MTAVINLKYNNGFKWFRDKRIFCKGYIYANQIYHENEDLLNYFKNNLPRTESLPAFLSNLNGVFSLVIHNEGSTSLYSDKTRFFPLFYTLEKSTISISDEPGILSKDQSIDPLAAKEFRRTGFVSGSNTLLNNVYQVQSGELVVYENSILLKKSLFSFRVRPHEIVRTENPVDDLKSHIDETFSRLAISLTDKTPVIPLSGGYDSRLIACKIKDLGFNNAICFTYGRPGLEVETSKKTAEKLNLKWHFINYEEITKDRNLIQEEEFLNYYRYAGRYTSMFYLQEFPAVEYLKKNFLIPDNSVFLPGHSGDLLGGSQFIKVFPPDIKPEKVALQILHSKFFLYPTDQRLNKIFLQHISEEIGYLDDYLGYSIMEDWDIHEKIAKFIFNSSQVFAYFGYEVRFPFWDDELVNFIRTFPPEYRIGKKIYDQCLKVNYFEQNGVSFSRELQSALIKIKMQAVKDLIKPYLPSAIKKKLIRKHDWTCYNEMSKPMLTELSQELRRILPWKFNNSILINWYLMKINSGNTLR